MGAPPAVSGSAHATTAPSAATRPVHGTRLMCLSPAPLELSRPPKGRPRPSPGIVWGCTSVFKRQPPLGACPGEPSSPGQIPFPLLLLDLQHFGPMAARVEVVQEQNALRAVGREDGVVVADLDLLALDCRIHRRAGQTV